MSNNSVLLDKDGSPWEAVSVSKENFDKYKPWRVGKVNEK